MVSTWAQTNTRSSTRVTASSPNRCESRCDTGAEEAGHSLSPSAIRVACHSSSVVAMVAISARIRSASPRWLPSKRRGRCTLRIHRAQTTPISTSTANTSTRNAYQPWSPSQGNVACLETTPIMAITIVGPSTRKPQKMKAWIRPGPMRCSSLRWPSTIVASCSARRERSPVRLTGRTRLQQRHQEAHADGEQASAHRQRDGEHDGGDGDSYVPLTFLISAEIAGTTSCRSPITA